jgi:PhoH-like ATPase
LDIYQVCAIYALKEAPNTLLCGSYGSGKSLLATAYSLSTNNKKTFISRPNIAVDKKFSLGFLPGQLDEKLTPWMGGILSALYFIFSDTRAQINKDVEYNTYDFVKDTIFKKYFEMMPIETIQGISFMKDDILILDESQLCSISVFSTILSRFGKGSKLIATGDIKQMYDTIKPSESGLLKLLRLLPSEHMAYVELKNNYRSGLLYLADKLQNNDIY